MFRLKGILSLAVIVSALSLIAPGPVAAEIPEEGVAGPEATLVPSMGMEKTTAAADSILAAMIAGIVDDSIYHFIEKLSGEVPVALDYGEREIHTRYSGTYGCDHATDFLADLFTAYGYDVEIHHYFYDKSLQSLVMNPDGTGLIGGEDGHVLRTVDGESWMREKAGIDTLPATVRDMDRIGGDDYVFVGNAGAAATSDDGGVTWTVRASGTAERLDGVSVLTGGTGWAVGRNGAIVKTVDGGASWSAQASGVLVFLRDVEAIDILTAVAVGDGGTVLRTTDGGATWLTMTSGTANDLNRLAIFGSTLWAVGDGGTIVTSVDGGAIWDVQTSDTANDLSGVSFSSALSGWACGANGTILRSTNGGVSWSAQSNPMPTISFRGVGAVSETEAWVIGLVGKLLHTTDGGATWVDRQEAIDAGWANVVATKTGTSLPDEVVLLGGHFDSVSELAETLAPGADDNGSGIAAIVESARNMADVSFERTVQFVCFSGEETGLHGSAACAARADALGTNIVGMFNLDSVGWNDNYFRIFSNESSDWLGDMALNMAYTWAPSLTSYHWYCPTCTWSDHSSFWNHGFDAIVGIETWDPAPPQHHTTGDTLGLMDIPLVADVTAISLATIATIAGIDTSGVSTTVENDGDIPESISPVFTLEDAEPNPFNPSTTIRFTLAAEGPIDLAVYTTTGRLVIRLADDVRRAGPHAVTWDGTDGNGRAVPSGTYLYRLAAGASSETKKMVLVR